MKRKAPRQRNTLAKQIKVLAGQDTSAAQQLAAHGRVPSEIEAAIRFYVASVERLRLRLTNEERQAAQSALASSAEMLSAQFLQAIAERDPTTLSEIALAIELFKAQGAPHPQPYDRTRTHLLSLKSVLDEKGEKRTIREVATFLARKNFAETPRLDTPADGFSRLRRICQEINFPLAETRHVT